MKWKTSGSRRTGPANLKWRARILAVLFLAGMLATSAWMKASPAIGTAPALPGNAVSNGVDWNDPISGTVNLDWANAHLTPRGIDMQDRGLVFQPVVNLDWHLYEAAASNNPWLDHVTFKTALFNDFDTVRSGNSPGNWSEIDYTFGPELGLWKNWVLGSPFTIFKSQNGSFATCWAWDPQLVYHDQWFGRFSINPYVEFFDELQNKITVVLVPSRSKSSFYGVVGVAPAYRFERLPLVLELPAYILIPGANFYQQANGSGGGTDLGLFAASLRVRLDLSCLGPDFDHWTLYGGVQYQYLNNPGLLDGNLASVPGAGRQRDFLVFHGGVTFHF